MALSDAEVEALRFHLGYGNVDVGAYPYTPDGFREIFASVIGPNLTGTVETSATTAIAAGAAVAVTPVAMTGIVTHARLVVDVGDAAEIVAVRSVTATTFTAVFANAHPAAGYPIALLGGQARVRMLLHQADKAWQGSLSSDVTDNAGIKQLDKGDIIFFEGFRVLRDRLEHYKSIVSSISSIVRVEPVWAGENGRATQLEAY